MNRIFEEKTLTLELRDTEIAFLQTLLRQLTIAPSSPDAMKTVEMVQSILRSLEGSSSQT